ncbi:MAG: recombinase XerC, partial [Alphaproteobacteria bacterium]|nr:recombinase XerC [Alphaproteobacteria bacterium]
MIPSRRKRPAETPPSSGAIAFPAEPALIRAAEEWRRWLRDEKRCSRHTLDAYGRDAAAFFAFLAEHLGYPPGLSDLEKLALVDFRGFLAGRSRLGLARSSTA